jgi:hypothetical protein
MIQLKEHYECLQSSGLDISPSGAYKISDHDLFYQTISPVLLSEQFPTVIEPHYRNKVLEIILYFWDLSSTLPFEE